MQNREQPAADPHLFMYDMQDIQKETYATKTSVKSCQNENEANKHAVGTTRRRPGVSSRAKLHYSVKEVPSAAYIFKTISVDASPD